VCQTPAVLVGTDEFQPGEPGLPAVKPVVRFDIDGFSCRICGLRLRSKAEMIAAGLWTRMEITPADPADE
jgi:hypothetical protein